MKPQTLEYYNWDDVEQFLSDAMGIDMTQRKYVGNISYWNIWCDIINHRGIRNCSYYTTHLSEDWLQEYEERLYDFVDWDDDESPLKLIDALRKLREEIGKDQITIYYSW